MTPGQADRVRQGAGAAAGEAGPGCERRVTLRRGVLVMKEKGSSLSPCSRRAELTRNTDASAIYRRAGDNPFHLEQLARRGRPASLARPGCAPAQLEVLVPR
jgi:hypothetical protein